MGDAKLALLILCGALGAPLLAVMLTLELDASSPCFSLSVTDAPHYASRSRSRLTAAGSLSPSCYEQHAAARRHWRRLEPCSPSQARGALASFVPRSRANPARSQHRSRQARANTYWPALRSRSPRALSRPCSVGDRARHTSGEQGPAVLPRRGRRPHAAPWVGAPAPPATPNRLDAARPGPHPETPIALLGPPAETQAAPLEDGPRTISIAVLGPLAIDGLLGRIKRAATRELFAYLAFHPNGATRDELLEAIWPAQDPKRTLPRFWQSVTDARKALGEAGFMTPSATSWTAPRSASTSITSPPAPCQHRCPEPRPPALERALALWRENHWRAATTSGPKERSECSTPPCRPA